MKKPSLFWLIGIMVPVIIIVAVVRNSTGIWERNVAENKTPAATKPWPTVPATSTPTPPFTPTPTTGPTSTPTATPTPSPSPTPTPRVRITDVRTLGRLETVVYLVETAIDLEKEPENTWQRLTGIFGTDKVLLLASGEVVAGTDLRKISDDDIIIQGDSITLWLPKPEVFYTRLDNQDTRVYLREKGLFYPYDKDLESRARQNAEKAMYEKALKHDILKKAGQNAVRDMEQFLKSLGFTDVNVFTRR